MQRRRLGQSGVVASEIGLGTMTFGTQCDEPTSFQILDFARERGIDFFDAAELYPVPPSMETFGRTEEILGKWMGRQVRHTLIIATKVAGPSHGWFRPPVRDGFTALDRHQVIRACEASLRRLNTDYIDLYQTHWPDHGFGYEETLRALTELQRSGKIRLFGCSNETSWGLMKKLVASREMSARSLPHGAKQFQFDQSALRE